MLCMKTPLKYDTRIRLGSSFNCTLVVAPDGIFIIFSAEIQSAPVFVRSEIQSATLLHRDVAALRADVARLCCHLPLSPRWPLRRSRIQAPPTLAETVTHRLISLLEVSPFSLPHHFLLQFHPHADLGLGFRCPDGNCGGSLAQSRISRSDTF